jgi:hypothetical protein
VEAGVGLSVGAGVAYLIFGGPNDFSRQGNTQRPTSPLSREYYCGAEGWT